MGVLLGTLLGTDLTPGSGGGPVDPPNIPTPWIGDQADGGSGSTYQWQRDGVDIGGATSRYYTFVAADIGPQIRCVVNGTPTSAVQHLFPQSVARRGTVDDCAYWWDFNDHANGAFSSLPDKMAGLNFSLVGTGVSVDTSVGGMKTLVATGSGGLDSAAAITRLDGAFGVTVMCCPVRVGTNDNAVICESGDFASVARTFGLRNRGPTNAVQFGANYRADGGGSGQTGYASTDTLSSAVAWHFGTDSRRHHPMSDMQYKNNTKVTAATMGYTGNARAGTDTLDGTKTLSLFQRSGGTNRWNGKLVGGLAIYRRELLPDERVHASLVMAYLCGVSSASVDSTLQTPAGYAVVFPGQSNSVGYDNVSYPGTQPTPWPDADVSPYLYELTGDQTTSPTRIALAEPVNGLGGTHYVSFLSELCRAAGYGSTSIEFLCIPAPPINGTNISSWQKGDASQKWSGMMKKIWWALVNGYSLQGLNMYQGESDAINVGDYPLFAARTTQFLTDTATYALRPGLRVLLHRLHATQPTGFPYWPNIRTEIDNVSFTGRIISDASGTLMADNLHLTTDAQRAQGYTDATAWLAAHPAAAS
jgi:hypothetical protein